MSREILVAFSIVTGLAHVAIAEEVQLRCVCWNLESGESDVDLLKTQVSDKKKVDIWGFSEVEDASVMSVLKAAYTASEESNYEVITSTQPFHSDKLGILYNSDRLNLLSTDELLAVQTNNAGLRPCLLATFQGKQTGQKFMIGVVHLKAGGNGSPLTKRVQQSKILNDFAETQSVPFLLMGDFNYNYPTSGSHEPDDFEELVEDGVFDWMKPSSLVKTQANTNFNTVLDFVFVANRIPGWTGEAVILNRVGDTPATSHQLLPVNASGSRDDNKNTDHRPVSVVFTFTEQDRDDAIEELETDLELLKSRIQELESRIEALKSTQPD